MGLALLPEEVRSFLPYLFHDAHVSPAQLRLTEGLLSAVSSGILIYAACVQILAGVILCFNIVRSRWSLSHLELDHVPAAVKEADFSKKASAALAAGSATRKVAGEFQNSRFESYLWYMYTGCYSHVSNVQSYRINLETDTKIIVVCRFHLIQYTWCECVKGAISVCGMSCV